MAERKVIADIRKWIKLNHPNIFIRKHHGGPFSSVGVLDLFLCINGKFVAIELKDKGKKPTLNQLATIEEIKKAGGYANWFDNADDAIKYLEHFIYLK